MYNCKAALFDMDGVIINSHSIIIFYNFNDLDIDKVLGL